MNHALLIELGSEEIPARMVAGLARQFAEQVAARLATAGLIAAPAEAPKVFWTPRRLAALFPFVAPQQPNREEEQIGPPARLAFTAENAATPQALSFAAKFGASAADLYRVSTPKGDYVAVRRRHIGMALSSLLGLLLPEAFAALNLPKAMQWQGPSGARFVRPLRWLLVMHGATVLPVELAGLTSGGQTRGHRHSNDDHVTIDNANGYIDTLKEHDVIVDWAEREAMLRRQLSESAAHAGWSWRPDEALLATLRDLTENPAVVLGTFAPAYLELPSEVLVTVMRDHQKYFALNDSQGHLCPGFLAVTDVAGEPREDRVARIRHGHERVLRARFNDARFFWQTDRKRTLHSRVDDLGHVTFHAKLGDYGAKTRRNLRLAHWLASAWKAETKVVALAAQLAKCDLTTELVKEFTELQGKIGGLYAAAEGLGDGVRDAIYFQYEPLTTESPAPPNQEAAAVGVADKLDTLAGMFLVQEIPTGSRDPFALRRQANGVIRTLLERDLALDLNQALETALGAYGPDQGDHQATRLGLQQFFLERLEYYLREVGGHAVDSVRAVLTVSANDPLDARRRVEAVTTCRREAASAFAGAAAAMKRIRNIVRKENWTTREWSADLLRDPAEQALAEKLRALPVEHARWQQRATVAGGDPTPYQHQLLQVAATGPVLDQFFTAVRVNDDDPRLRANRLGLLAFAAHELSRVADFSEIVFNED